MPRGKKSLLETTELPVVKTEIEEGTLPFFIIEDFFGVAVDDYCYMLCEKKLANRTIKDEAGNPHHVETYYKWDSIKYTNTFRTIIESYLELKEKRLNARQVRTKEYKALINTQKELQDILKAAFSVSGVNKDFISFCDLVDKKEAMLQQIAELTTLKNKLEKESNDLLDLIKEKRQIIIKQTEPTKHKVKLEK